jgi:hypothetical protein
VPLQHQRSTSSGVFSPTPEICILALFNRLFIARSQRTQYSDDTLSGDNVCAEELSRRGSCGVKSPSDRFDSHFGQFFLTSKLVTVIVQVGRLLGYHRRVTRRERAYGSSHSDFWCFHITIIPAHYLYTKFCWFFRQTRYRKHKKSPWEMRSCRPVAGPATRRDEVRGKNRIMFQNSTPSRGDSK